MYDSQSSLNWRCGGIYPLHQPVSFWDSLDSPVLWDCLSVGFHRKKEIWKQWQAWQVREPEPRTGWPGGPFRYNIDGRLLIRV